ncbi:MAG: AMIN domain-containing protein [Alphaproteobacteria bacterium]|nr:AMIN domain-containing protein [Alphaproteobacteria bacterium]
MDEQPDAPQSEFLGGSESEKLLAAEGSWNIVDETQSGIPSPEQMHAQAAAQVDPNELSARHSYTTPAAAMDVNTDMNTRVLKLEQQVASLNRNFKKLLPPLSKLIISDRALDQAIDDIEREYDTQNSPAAVSPPPSSPQKRADMQADTAQSGTAEITAVRVGQHPGKSRIVIDVGQPASFSTDLDNKEKILVIELPKTALGAVKAQRVAKNVLIAGYNTQAVNGKGARLIVELKKPVKIVSAAPLAPSNGKGHRIMLDLAAQ